MNRHLQLCPETCVDQPCDLRVCHLRGTWMPPVAEALARDTSVTVLSLSFSYADNQPRLDVRAARPLADVLRVNRTLRTLILCGHAFGDEGAAILAGGARGKHHAHAPGPGRLRRRRRGRAGAAARRGGARRAGHVHGVGGARRASAGDVRACLRRAPSVHCLDTCARDAKNEAALCNAERRCFARSVLLLHLLPCSSCMLPTLHYCLHCRGGQSRTAALTA